MKQVGSAAKLLLVAVVLAVAAFAVSGCGDDSSSNGGKEFSNETPLGESKKTVVDSENSFDAQQQAVIAQITAFGDATASKDYEALCEDLLSKEASKIGGDCVGTFKKTGVTITDFKLSIQSVTVAADGKTATAKVEVTSNSSPEPQTQDISLVKEGGEWRLQILGQ